MTGRMPVLQFHISCCAEAQEIHDTMSVEIMLSELNMNQEINVNGLTSEQIDQVQKLIAEFKAKNQQINDFIPEDMDYLSSVSTTLSEWLSPEDDKAYNDL